MRRDLFIGLFVALAFHVGVAWLGEVYRAGPEVVKVKAEPHAIQITMHTLEPDPPDPQDVDQDTPPDITPPMQTDVPQIITDTSFVQQLEPPPPENLQMNKGVITIPKGEHSFNGMKVFDLKSLDQEPEKKYTPAPVYPFDMHAQGVTGTVVVAFIVDQNGDVQQAYAKSSTRREFELAATSAVSKWKFRPGRKGGRSVLTRMEIPIEFNLSSGE
jgi:protein TonB